MNSYQLLTAKLEHETRLFEKATDPVVQTVAQVRVGMLEEIILLGEKHKND